MKSLSPDEYQSRWSQAFFAFQRSSFSSGARETSAKLVSRVWRCSRKPGESSSIPAVQLGQPSSHDWSNMKW